MIKGRRLDMITEQAEYINRRNEKNTGLPHITSSSIFKQKIL